MAQGLVSSLFREMDIKLLVPHYSTVGKRQATLNVELLKKKSKKAKTLLDLIFDSTGLKGYRSIACFDAIANCGGQAVIDIQRGVKPGAETSLGSKQRNDILLKMRACGRKVWKEQRGYHRRSLVETQMFRWKKILGAGLSSRKLAHQAVEARIKAKILNIFASIGMPKTETVTA